MKKSIIAGGIIVILAVGYVGASWYTGNVIQNQMDEKITTLTDKINSSNNLSKVEITYSDYDKGIFSTSLNLKIVDLNSEKTFFNNDVTIYHGPFPWSSIKSADFLPKMAAIYTQLSEQTSKELWQAAGNKPFTTLNLAIDYSENMHLTADNEPLDFQSEKSNLKMKTTKNTLVASVDKDLHNISFESKMDELQLTDTLNDSIKISNVNLTGNFSGTDVVDFKGTQNLTIGNIGIQKNDTDLTFNQVKVISTSAKNKNLQDNTLSLMSNQVTYGQEDLGQLEIQSKYSFATSEMGDDILDLSLDNLRLQTKQGDLSAIFKIKMIGDALNFNELTEDNVLFMEASSNLPLQQLAYLGAQLSNPDKKEPEEQDIQSTQQAIMMLSQMLLSNYSFVDVNMNNEDSAKNGIFVDLYYSKSENQARLKGQPVTLQQFWQAIAQNNAPQF